MNLISISLPSLEKFSVYCCFKHTFCTFLFSLLLEEMAYTSSSLARWEYLLCSADRLCSYLVSPLKISTRNSFLGYAASQILRPGSWLGEAVTHTQWHTGTWLSSTAWMAVRVGEDQAQANIAIHLSPWIRHTCATWSFQIRLYHHLQRNKDVAGTTLKQYRLECTQAKIWVLVVSTPFPFSIAIRFPVVKTPKSLATLAVGSATHPSKGTNSLPFSVLQMVSSPAWPESLFNWTS